MYKSFYGMSSAKAMQEYFGEVANIGPPKEKKLESHTEEVWKRPFSQFWEGSDRLAPMSELGG